MEVIEAVYEDGVLKPLKKPHLREGEKVRIKIIARDIAEFIRTAEGIKRPKKDPLQMLEEVRER
ncbi:antitoxin family protein [Thermococcus sp.]|uniref:antitoxin family protein n=1 Tax=Thermococcus sp. TaxID=35749 RepID=UPI0026260AD4|nr:antitoxin family protein [Thermococcus sp.]